MPNGRQKSHRFSLMSEGELLDYCRGLYDRGGFDALTFKALKAHDSLYFHLFARGIRQRDLVQRLGLEAAFATYRQERPLVRNGTATTRWSWAVALEKAREAKEQHGFLPPASWFQENGQGSLVTYVYAAGHTWEELRDALGDFHSSRFVESRSGVRWRSHPEASLSNFLYARGIQHRRGERYPDQYDRQSGRAFGMYDLHFEVEDRTFDVEIWGDKPGGHNEENYASKRAQKEAFNASNPNFLGIEFRDCYSDARLTAILEPFIGLVEPHVFERPTDRLIESSHWSNADELLEFCKKLAAEMPDCLFPTEGWLRKRGNWSGRPGPTYNTASIYIKKWLGGVRNVRRLLGQSAASTLQWDRDTALAAWREFWVQHGITPGQVRPLAGTARCALDAETIVHAGRIVAAVEKYAGGRVAANALLGITQAKTRKWPRERIVADYQNLIDRFQVSASQVLADHRSGKAPLKADEVQHIQQMVDATVREFGGTAALHEILGFKTPSRPRRRRARAA